MFALFPQVSGTFTSSKYISANCKYKGPKFVQDESDILKKTPELFMIYQLLLNHQWYFHNLHYMKVYEGFKLIISRAIFQIPAGITLPLTAL